MIFVFVGTHPQQFNRLLIELDGLVARGIIKETVVAQVGASTYVPQNFKTKNFLSYSILLKNIKKSSFVITHAGAGNIIDAMTLHKKIIVVPRLKKFGEHTDNHQIELASALEKSGRVMAVYNIGDLETVISKIKKFKPKKKDKNILAKKLESYLKNLSLK